MITRSCRRRRKEPSEHRGLDFEAPTSLTRRAKGTATRGVPLTFFGFRSLAGTEVTWINETNSLGEERYECHTVQ